MILKKVLIIISKYCISFVLGGLIGPVIVIFGLLTGIENKGVYYTPLSLKDMIETINTSSHPKNKIA